MSRVLYKEYNKGALLKSKKEEGNKFTATLGGYIPNKLREEYRKLREELDEIENWSDDPGWVPWLMKE